MTPQEANAVLGYAVAADNRLASSSEDQAKARAQVWADLLGPVDAQYALDHVRRYYRHHRDWPVTPGAICDAWRHHVAAQESKARTAARPELTRPQPGESVRPLIERCKEEARAATTPERPPTGRLRYVPDAVFEGGLHR